MVSSFWNLSLFSEVCFWYHSVPWNVTDIFGTCVHIPDGNHFLVGVGSFIFCSVKLILKTFTFCGFRMLETKRVVIDYPVKCRTFLFLLLLIFFILYKIRRDAKNQRLAGMNYKIRSLDKEDLLRSLLQICAFNSFYIHSLEELQELLFLLPVLWLVRTSKSRTFPPLFMTRFFPSLPVPVSVHPSLSLGTFLSVDLLSRITNHCFQLL